MTDEQIEPWYKFWDNITPGTVFKVRGELLVWTKPNNSYNTYNSVFNVKNGTIHHFTEYFTYHDGIEYVKSCIVENIH